MLKVKICGLTNENDAAVVRAAGAEYAGCVLGVPTSPRNVSPEQARRVFAVAGAVGVAVVVNPAAAQLTDVCRTSGCRILQLSGEEPPEWIAENRDALPAEVWKTVHLSGRVEEPEFRRAVGRVRAYLEAGVTRILVDRAGEGGSRRAYGGTGQRPDWNACARLQEATGAPLVLAGGLRPETVPAAIARVHPDVVDVSSGVEAAPGRKDAAAVRAFILAARSAK